jgi:hypothetical protein
MGASQSAFSGVDHKQLDRHNKCAANDGADNPLFGNDIAANIGNKEPIQFAMA